MYANGQPAGNVKKFIDIPKTPEGKKIISETGFVNKYGLVSQKSSRSYYIKAAVLEA
jgi:hypothetical protein